VLATSRAMCHRLTLMNFQDSTQAVMLAARTGDPGALVPAGDLCQCHIQKVSQGTVTSHPHGRPAAGLTCCLDSIVKLLGYKRRGL
jgi:hypothetical protein